MSFRSFGSSSRTFIVVRLNAEAGRGKGAENGCSFAGVECFVAGSAMCDIRIQGEGRQSISLRIAGREFNECEDYWDGNWLNTRMELSVGGFRGAVDCYTRVEEFAKFEEQLRAAYESLSGRAEFRTLEAQLSLTFEFGSRGDVLVRGEVLDQAGIGNRLNFRLELDQSFVSPVLDALAQLREKYPLRGQRPMA